MRKLKDTLECAKKWEGAMPGSVERDALFFLRKYYKLLETLQGAVITWENKPQFEMAYFLSDYEPEKKTMTWQELKEFYEKHPLTKEELLAFIERMSPPQGNVKCRE